MELHKLNALDCFSYELPEDRIAQRPVYPYDAAKMLVARRSGGKIVDSTFAQFHEILKAGDLVVFNNSKVIPARLFGAVQGRTSNVEILLLREIAFDRWIALGRPLKKLHSGVVIDFGNQLTGTIQGRNGEMEVEILLHSLNAAHLPRTLIAQHGSMPIPPYIRDGKSDDQDRKDYQPLFAKIEGSVAAPTASLHFTPEVIDRIRGCGAQICDLTLHVGAASFLPLWREGQSLQLTPPGSEKLLYSENLVRLVKQCKQTGGRVVAVGTTVVRALESMLRSGGMEEGAALDTELFITPGFTWQAVDLLVTNFHQPRTTHLLLVEAFAGREVLTQAYTHALASNYRFLSYGDGMVVLPE